MEHLRGRLSTRGHIDVRLLVDGDDFLIFISIASVIQLCVDD